MLYFLLIFKTNKLKFTLNKRIGESPVDNKACESGLFAFIEIKIYQFILQKKFMLVSAMN